MCLGVVPNQIKIKVLSKDFDYIKYSIRFLLKSDHFLRKTPKPSNGLYPQKPGQAAIWDSTGCSRSQHLQMSQRSFFASVFGESLPSSGFFVLSRSKKDSNTEKLWLPFFGEENRFFEVHSSRITPSPPCGIVPHEKVLREDGPWPQVATGDLWTFFQVLQLGLSGSFFLFFYGTVVYFLI